MPPKTLKKKTTNLAKAAPRADDAGARLAKLESAVKKLQAKVEALEKLIDGEEELGAEEEGGFHEDTDPAGATKLPLGFDETEDGDFEDEDFEDEEDEDE